MLVFQMVIILNRQVELQLVVASFTSMEGLNNPGLVMVAVCAGLNMVHA